MRADRAFAAALGLSTTLVAGGARAFPTGDRFDLDPTGLDSGATGGGGVRYTGGPSFPTATCATCHTGAPGRVGVRVEADPVDLFSVGYQPGASYVVELDLTGETRGLEWNAAGPRCGRIARTPFKPCNANGFALEVADENGASAGTLVAGDTTLLIAGGAAVASRGYLPAVGQLPAGDENGATHWRFRWTAPAAGTGPVTFHAGVVDGNGGDGTEALPNDLVGDDVAVAHLTIAEAGGAPLPAAGVACAAVGRRGGPVTPLLVLWLGSWLVRRSGGSGRRRRRHL